MVLIGYQLFWSFHQYVHHSHLGVSRLYRQVLHPGITNDKSTVVTDDVASESRVDQRILTAHYKMITEDGEFVDNIA